MQRGRSGQDAMDELEKVCDIWSVFPPWHPESTAPLCILNCNIFFVKKTSTTKFVEFFAYETFCYYISEESVSVAQLIKTEENLVA